MSFRSWRPGGVLVRAGHTEAGCDLALLAGLEPAAVICEILKEDGSMARLGDLVDFARTHGLKIGTIADLIHYRSRHETLVERTLSKTGAVAPRRIHPARVHRLHLERGAPGADQGRDSPDKETLVRVHEPLSVVDFLDPGRRSAYFFAGRWRRRRWPAQRPA
jgi:3,4-dihydroxy 2-butanone 4-phosphate synthase/GTP cyclohydrolase II